MTKNFWLRSLWPLSLGALLIINLSGCESALREHGPRIINEPTPPAANIRKTFGIVGILPPQTSASFTFNTPENLTEATKSVTGNVYQTLSQDNYDPDFPRVGRYDSDPSDTALSGLILSPIYSGIAGLAGGILMGVPQQEISRAQAAMQRALKEAPLENGIAEELTRLAQSQGNSNVALISKPLTNTVSTNGLPDLRDLAKSGIDSALVIKVVTERLKVEDGINPPMPVTTTVDYTIVRVSDGSVLYAGFLIYEGQKRKFTAWGANNAQAFRAELAAAQRTFAATIFEQIAARGE